jgi:dextranase
MDISPDSPWTDHIAREFRRVIAEAGFDGLHLDQYGFPKRALRPARSGDGGTEPVDLAACYPAFINRVKQELLPIRPDVGLIFNNVSAYPVHTTASADQEAVYIEVWPPYERYADLKRLIDRGRELGGGKHVILAAYLHAFKEAMPEPRGPVDEAGVTAAENGALLTMATVLASGGFHLALGEEGAVLTEAYYPDYRPMRPAFAAEVRRWCDFAVRHSEALHGFDLTDLSMMYTGGINAEIRFFHESAAFHPEGGPGTVWTMVKRGRDGLVLHLLNLTGVESDRWNEGKAARPTPVEGIRCEVAAETWTAEVYAASPDDVSPALRPVPYELEDSTEHGKKIVFTLPPLRIWTMVLIRTA